MGDLALPCPGARERGPRWSSVDQRMWKESKTMEARGTAGGKRALLLRRDRPWGRCGGHFLSAFPVLLCSRARPRSRIGTWGWGLSRTWSWGRGRTRTLGVVHVLSSRASVGLPMWVVVLLKLCCSRRMWVQRCVFRRGGVLIIWCFLFIRLLTR